MRERSGGVHCESYEELIDILDSHGHHCPTCPNIDDFLRDQENNSLHQSAHSDFFFEPLRQMQQEEQDELERTLQSDLSCRLVRTEIAIICQQLQTVLWELLDRKGIHQFYSAACLPSTEPVQSVYVAVDGSTVSVSLRGIEVSPQMEARSEEDGPRDEVDQAKEGGAKQKTVDDSEPRQNRLLQLVIYYNRVQQGQSLQNHQQTLSSPKSIFQHKIWLVQQTDDYKQLLTTYTDSAQFLFTATQNPTPLPNTKNTIYQQIRPVSASSRCQSQPSKGGCVLRDVLSRVEAVRQCW